MVGMQVLGFFVTPINRNEYIRADIRRLNLVNIFMTGLRGEAKVTPEVEKNLSPQIWFQIWQKYSFSTS